MGLVHYHSSMLLSGAQNLERNRGNNLLEMNCAILAQPGLHTEPGQGGMCLGVMIARGTEKFFSRLY
ncbi:hypothetical protein E2542_SST14762 [Spatholobus suberectus]|nr:hypothetical protein E2542_SST14762 [Spatholobus suberectus]